MNAKPTHEIRLGMIRAAIWKKDIATGPRFNATFSRLYKAEGNKWASSDTFGRDDLLLLAKVANEVHSWMMLQHQDRQPPIGVPSATESTH